MIAEMAMSGARPCPPHNLIMKRENHPFLLSVPVHSGKRLKPGTLRGLLRAADLAVEEFVELLEDA